MTGDRVSPSGEVGFDPSTDDVPAALAPRQTPLGIGSTVSCQDGVYGRSATEVTANDICL